MASLTEEQLRKEFRRVDKNNDGTITVAELRKYYLPMQEMLGVKPELAEQEIQGLLKRLDTDNSGTISFEGINFFIYIFIELFCFFSRIQIILLQSLNQ
jgi:Ca2+-binding EF-hand superfamily protein